MKIAERPYPAITCRHGSISHLHAGHLQSQKSTAPHPRVACASRSEGDDASGVAVSGWAPQRCMPRFARCRGKDSVTVRDLVARRYPARADNELATIDRARQYVDASRADATHRAYASDWRDFLAYCEPRSLEPMPAEPQAIVLYVTHLAERAKLDGSASLRRHRADAQGTGLRKPVRHEIVRRVIRGIAPRKAPHKSAKRLQPRPSASDATRDSRRRPHG